MLENSENFNSLRPILFELCKKNYRRGGQIDPPPAGIGLSSFIIALTDPGEEVRPITKTPSDVVTTA